MFLVFIKFRFLWKNGVSEKKKKLIYPSTPQHCNSFLASTFLILFKKLSVPPPLKKEGRDYAFSMRDDKGEKIKLLSFHMTDFLLTEL